jgi:hypothetical protein
MSLFVGSNIWLSYYYALRVSRGTGRDGCKGIDVGAGIMSFGKMGDLGLAMLAG